MWFTIGRLKYLQVVHNLRARTGRSARSPVIYVALCLIGLMLVYYCFLPLSSASPTALYDMKANSSSSKEVGGSNSVLEGMRSRMESVEKKRKKKEDKRRKKKKKKAHKEREEEEEEESPAAGEATTTLISEYKPVVASVVGNLGPPSVVTDPKAADWLKDRWQIAKNMQGQSLPLPQWIYVDLQGACSVVRINLDWETAFASEYCIETRKETRGFGASKKVNSEDNDEEESEESDEKEENDEEGKKAAEEEGRTEKAVLASDEAWTTVYCRGGQQNREEEEEEVDVTDSKPSRQHVVHDIAWPKKSGRKGKTGKHASKRNGVRWVRVKILKNGLGYGASLWHLSVFGHCSSSLAPARRN